MKQSGILLHITSLSTQYGIGDLGPAAYRFADYLAKQGHHIWQILPLNVCGYKDSPYNPISAFAFNPLLISPELLCRDGLIPQSMLYQIETNSTVDYTEVARRKQPLLRLAAQNYLKKHDIAQYIEANAWHLKPYLCYLYLSDFHDNERWYEWPEEHRRYSDELFEKCQQTTLVLEAAAIQAIFEDQMRRLREHLSGLGIKLFGDLPLYLSYESAELWAHQELFDLDHKGRRLSVAGVPPDAFSESGQLWGNPIYKWDLLREQGFELFIRRFRHVLKYLDLLRLDHFIGYVNFWRVPCIDLKVPESAANGSWVKAQPDDFFDTIVETFGIDRFIAEDLGILNDDVCSIRDTLGLPGMIVLHFCFEESVPDVHSFPSDRIIYTGTHDNNTSRGWWNALESESLSKKHLEEYCRIYLPEYGPPTTDNIAQIMIEIARLSGCERMIIPMQDLLNLDESARMNLPGTALGNWKWRMTQEP